VYHRVLRDVSLNGQPVKTVVVIKHSNFVINVKVLKDSPALEDSEEDMFIPRMDFPMFSALVTHYCAVNSRWSQRTARPFMAAKA
jgi:hypothetical protein